MRRRFWPCNGYDQDYTIACRNYKPTPEELSKTRVLKVTMRLPDFSAEFALRHYLRDDSVMLDTRTQRAPNSVQFFTGQPGAKQTQKQAALTASLTWPTSSVKQGPDCDYDYGHDDFADRKTDGLAH